MDRFFLSKEFQERMRIMREEFGAERQKAIPIFEDVTRYPLDGIRKLVLLEREIMACKTSEERLPLIKEFASLRDSLKLLPNAPDRIYLWPKGKVPTLTEYTDNSNFRHMHEPDFQPYMLEVLLPTDIEPVGAIITIAGGEQGPNTISECYQICCEFRELGYQTFILHCRPHNGPWGPKETGADIARAIRIIRRDAAKYRVAPDRIAVAGFSNGGCATEDCVRYYTGKQTVAQHFPGYQPDELDEFSGAPDIVLYIYGSRHKGTEFDYTEVVYPPTFLATGLEDKIGIINLYALMQDLIERDVRLEVHTFAAQPHGYAGWKILEGGGNPNFDFWVTHAHVFMQDTYENYR